MVLREPGNTPLPVHSDERKRNGRFKRIRELDGTRRTQIYFDQEPSTSQCIGSEPTQEPRQKEKRHPLTKSITPRPPGSIRNSLLSEARRTKRVGSPWNTGQRRQSSDGGKELREGRDHRSLAIDVSLPSGGVPSAFVSGGELKKRPALNSAGCRGRFALLSMAINRWA
jgi:hypothetical protein